MDSKKKFRRKNYFINKRFQTNFIVKFFILILLEVVLAIGVFAYITSGTITTGYMGPDLKVEKTLSFFLPSFSILYLIVALLIGLSGIVVFLLVSHKIAGPLYNFEKSLNIINKGDLSHRCNLRQSDQLITLAESLNNFTSTIDHQIGEVKLAISETIELLDEIQTSLPSGQQDRKISEASLNKVLEKLRQIKNSTDYFKASKERNNSAA